MLRYRLARLLLALGMPALVLAGCAPVAPIVRDGMGHSLPINNAAVGAVTPVGSPGAFTTPWDAAPDPQGKTIYIVGEGPDGSGLFAVPAEGGAVTPIVIGAPFTDPTGVAVAVDGSTVYIADGKGAGLGAIFAVDLDSGEVKTVAGTEGLSPYGLEVAATGASAGATAGTDAMLYFSGKAADQPAIYRIAAAGGKPELLAAGAPLVEPVGVAVAKDGTVYTADRLAGGNGLAAAFRIDAEGITRVADGFRAGERVVGAALTPDDQVLLVSAMDAEQPSAQVLATVLATGDQFVITKEVGLHPGSGGVHRAHAANVYAWADSGGGRSRSTCSPCVMRIDAP